MSYFITAIGTDSGKTLVSAIILRAINGKYWKPVQSGEPTDTNLIKSWLGSHFSYFPEKYRFKTPVSPHAAAKIDNIEVSPADFTLPDTGKELVVEGAGGLMVPINYNGFLMADLIKQLDIPVILVSNIYLGNINHTLLTAAELKRRNIKTAGIVFNGPENKETKEVILSETQLPCLLHVYREEEINLKTIDQYAKKFQDAISKKG